MKKAILITLMLLFCVSLGAQQRPQPTPEQIQAYLASLKPNPAAHTLLPNTKMARKSPYRSSKNFGKRIAVFGGSLSVNDESDAAKQIWADLLGAEVVTYGVGGAGFSREYMTSTSSGPPPTTTPIAASAAAGRITPSLTGMTKPVAPPSAAVSTTASKPCWRKTPRPKSTSLPRFASSAPTPGITPFLRLPTRREKPSPNTSRDRKRAAPTTAFPFWTSSTYRESTVSTRPFTTRKTFCT